MSEVASNPDVTSRTKPERQRETCHCIFLEQVKVVDGVNHRQTIRNAQDLIAGDEYRFPDMHPDTSSNICVNGEDVTIELCALVQVGRPTVRARRTHRITLMSDRGHVVPADVLITSDNRVLLSLRDAVSCQQDYVLILIVPTLAPQTTPHLSAE